MPANPPISNNSNDDNDEITVALHATPLFIEPAVAMVATADEALGAIHSSPTPSGKKPALETNRNIADPITPTGIILTPRQQRVLRYLARRRMRNARIIKRPTYDNTAIEAPVPAPARTMSIPEPVDAPGELPAPARTTPIPEPVDAPGESEQSLIDVPSISTQTLHTTSLPEAIIVPGEAKQLPEEVFLTSTQPLHTPPIPELPAKASAKFPQHRGYQFPRQASHKKLPVPQKGSPYREKNISSALDSKSMVEIPAKGSLAILPPAELGPLQTQKIRRRRVLRHLSRKYLRQARASEYRARRRLWMTIASTVLTILIILLSIGAAGSVTAYQFFTQTQTKYQHKVVTLYDVLPLDNLKMYDSKGVLLMQMTDQGIHTTVSLEQVAPVLVNATVATEDKNFWTNPGIDIMRIIRAALDDLRSGRLIEGGSTITQQLIKNLIVGNQATVVRKLEEIVLTPDVNSYYSKHDIMQMYLNSIYYGHQAYGIDAAATVYFGLEDKPGGKSAAMQLDLAQAAMLAGLPSSPSALDPWEHPQAAFNRMEAVLGLMVSQGYIKKVDALDALQEAQSPNFFKPDPSLTNRAPHFANFVLSQLLQLFHLKDQSQLSRSGMQVHTTLDISLQDKIQKIAQKHIAELRDTHHLTNAAEVLIDFRTGAIISLLGSIDYNDKSIDGQFDVATEGYRQPGSSFKPYVYVTAFKQGASPGQAIDDEPTTIDNAGGNPPLYSPTNYDLQFHGHMTLRCALQNSLNVPAVRVLQHVGIKAAMQTARDMGITSYMGTPGYSLVLGGLGIRLIDHTSTMGTFANAGVHVPYYDVEKVISGNTNQVLYQHQDNPGKRVISPQLAYMMTNVLSDNESRIPEFYDCNVLQLYSKSQDACYNGNRGVVRPAAAKTGTTENFRDNWTVGYTTDYVMGVWAGNDDNSAMYQVTGVMGAAPIWHDSMLLAEQGHPIRDFTNPGGLVQATVTYPDGVSTTDWFLPGTVPASVQSTLTPVPTAGTTSTPATPTPTSTPKTGAAVTAPIVHPYCPGSYSFAFNPPPEFASPNG